MTAETRWKSIVFHKLTSDPEMAELRGMPRQLPRKIPPCHGREWEACSTFTISASSPRRLRVCHGVRGRSSRLRVVVCDVVDLELSTCAAARWRSVEARQARLEKDQGILAPEGPPAFVFRSQAPQVYGARSPKLFSHCRRPRFTHRTTACQLVTASLVSAAVLPAVRPLLPRSPRACLKCMSYHPRNPSAPRVRLAMYALPPQNPRA